MNPVKAEMVAMMCSAGAALPIRPVRGVNMSRVYQRVLRGLTDVTPSTANAIIGSIGIAYLCLTPVRSTAVISAKTYAERIRKNWRRSMRIVE